MPSDNSWIAVAGATGGMGQALVARLTASGTNVVALARRPEDIAASAGPGRVVPVAWDALRPDGLPAVRRAVTDAVGPSPGLAGLVNMAGLIVEGPLEALTPDDLRSQMEVNLVAPFALTQALLPALTRARGRVVNIGAISAWVTPPFYGAVAASKSALSSLSDAMRLEFGPLGIRVVLIEPGAMRTDIFATSRAARDARLRRTPDLEARYRPALAAMDHAFEKAGADDPAVVVSAVMKVLFDDRPKPHVVVGKGTGVMVFLARLPAGLRDRLVKNALGLTRLLAAKP